MSLIYRSNFFYFESLLSYSSIVVWKFLLIQLSYFSSSNPFFNRNNILFFPYFSISLIKYCRKKRLKNYIIIKYLSLSFCSFICMYIWYRVGQKLVHIGFPQNSFFVVSPENTDFPKEFLTRKYLASNLW